jgi:hypothetical protein
LRILKHQFGGTIVSAPECWIDTTQEVESEDAPFTLTKKESGVGALQFSTALYSEGEEPNIDIARLEEMLADFASKKDLGEPFDKNLYESRVSVVAASYRSGSDLVRVWYCSDERNIALGTYICDWERRNNEVHECEEIVRSVRFRSN